MKQVTVLFISWFLAAFTYKAMAQEDVIKDNVKDKKKAEEIIIRKMGDKDVTITVQIKGDKVTINGKPITEFKDDNISINKRNMTVWDGDHMAMLEDLGRMGNMGGMGNFEMENFGSDCEGCSKVMLGVTTEKTEEGAKILEVTKESAAEKAGLQKGDVITKFGDTKIEDSQDLYDAVNKKKAKDEVVVEYKREGKVKSVKAALQERKEKTFAVTSPNGSYKSYTIPRVNATPRVYRTPSPDDIQNGMDFAFSYGRPKLGLKIQDTDEETGVKVLSVEENSASAKAGMKADDVIVAIGDQKVMNTDDAREALQENESKSAYKIKAKRNGNEMTFDIKIQKKLKTANL